MSKPIKGVGFLGETLKNVEHNKAKWVGEFVQKWNLNGKWNLEIYIFAQIIKTSILHSKNSFLSFFSVIRGTVY